MYDAHVRLQSENTGSGEVRLSGDEKEISIGQVEVRSRDGGLENETLKVREVLGARDCRPLARKLSRVDCLGRNPRRYCRDVTSESHN